MKAMLFIPDQYSIKTVVENALEMKGFECSHVNFRSKVKPWQQKTNTQMFRFPYSVRLKWEKYYFTIINSWYMDQIRKQNPDLIFIYNNEMMLPETLAWIKNRNIKIAFFLGDNPLYTPNSRFNLTVLEYADAVFVPDTFWQLQLTKIGLPDIYHLVLPLPETEYFPITSLSPDDIQRFQTDVLYVGMSYNDSWGYKKAKFLSFFVNSDLQIHGNSAWKRWFQFFPQIEKHFIEKKGYIPTEKLNRMYNCTKIIPVDGNPGIFNGIHIRIFEALSSGTLPLMEWNADMDYIFNSISDLPAVMDYRGIPEMVKYYLSNEDARQKMVSEMVKTYKNRFSDTITADYLIHKIGIS